MKNRNKQKMSIMQLILVTLFRVIDRLSNKAAGYFLYTIWLIPGVKKKKHDRILPETSEQFWLKINGKRIAYWVNGSGPTILFVHGWGSYGALFSKMITEFSSDGYRVIWFDAPAHGQSSGWQTNIFEIQQCISSLQEIYGHFEMVVGHSFGALSLMRAISEGLSVSKLVTLSSPSNTIELVDKFCFFFNPSKQSKEVLIKYIEKKYGDDLWDKTLVKNMAKNIEQPVLIIHDKNDQMISYQQGISNKKYLKRSELILTENLGHNRIVYNVEVTKKVLDFAKNVESKK